MLAIERRNEILEKLQNDRRVVVSELSQIYEVSEETIRRDLDKLVQDGFAIKSYGGAVINENVNIELPFNIRKNRNIVGKQHIAELVSEQIKDGDSIMLDASSTAVYVAKTLLEQGKKNLTVLTNSVEIIIELFGAQDWKVLSTGGESREGSFALVGYQTDRMLRSYHVDKAIISAKGIDMDAGLTDSDDLHANNKRTMLTRAKEKILAVDSSKFDRLAEVPYKKILIVTDPFMAKSKNLNLILDPIKKAGKEYDIFQDIVPDPPIEKISLGVKKMLEYKPDAIVAVGGGSAIDSSKSIREFALRVDHYAEVGLIAIPTTSGTGSEVTSFAVVSDPAEQRKYPLVSWELTPDEAILDAELVKSVPPAITADTGMDVFTHALEACVSTERSDFSTALAEKSIELVGVFLLRAYLDGNDTHARQKMHSASCLAGLAFNSASLGLNHGMAHQLGAKFHIPHGRANAMLLPHIIEFNSDINKHSKSQKEYLPAVKRYATVAQILGLSSYNEIMTVRSLVNWVQFMLKEMDIPLSISQMGTISEEEYFNAIDSMADAALEDGCTATNPRVPNKEDVIEIYKKLWK